MEGHVSVDLTSVPNILAIGCVLVVVLVVVSIIVTLIVKKLGIVSIGPIKMEQQSQSTMYDMNERIRDLDDICRKNMRQATGHIKINIGNVFAGLELCTVTRIALFSVMRMPLYESIMNNHFTTELMPGSYGAYRERIIEYIRDEFDALSNALKGASCGKEKLLGWDQIGDGVAKCVDSWLVRISREVISVCEKKIKVYEGYTYDFEKVRDAYRTSILQECITKNKNYISVLQARLAERL